MAVFHMCMILLAVASFSSCQNRGVQMRLTKKGMDYAVNVGISIMKNDLKKMVVTQKGTKGKMKYTVSGLRFQKLDFGKYELDPVQGTGMKGVVSGINIDAAGRLEYHYNSWIPISDKTNLKMKAEGINFVMTIKIGSDAKGRPTIAVQECNANVEKIDLDFSGGLSWIYNLVSSFIEDEMKVTFKQLLCNMAIKEINTKAKEELATFPVVKKIDDYAEIDYRLTSPPKFTDSYMDAYLKGEFKEAKNPKKSSLSIPTFKTQSDHLKMVYFWISDYTINTAGRVYHEANKLQVSFNAWDSECPDKIKSMLTTAKFGLLFPKILVQYPNQPMGVYVTSYKTPTTHITKDEVNFKLYAHAVFSVKSKELFTLQFDITAGGEIGVKKTNITAEISEFNYDGKVLKSSLGDPTVSLDNVFVRNIIDVLVIQKGNAQLQQGFPLPKVDEVTFKDFDILLIKDAIRVGTDLNYIKK